MAVSVQYLTYLKPGSVALVKRMLRFTTSSTRGTRSSGVKRSNCQLLEASWPPPKVVSNQEQTVSGLCLGAVQVALYLVRAHLA